MPIVATSTIALFIILVIAVVGLATVRAKVRQFFGWLWGIPRRVLDWRHQRRLAQLEIRKKELELEVLEEKRRNEEIWSPLDKGRSRDETPR